MTRYLVAAVFTLAIPAVAAADPINSLAALRSQDFGSPAGGGESTYEPPGGHSGGALGGGGSVSTPSFTFDGSTSKSGSSTTSTQTLTQDSGIAGGGSTSGAGTGSGGTAYSGAGGSGTDTSDGGLFGGISGFSLIESSRFDDPPPSATSYEPSWLTPAGPTGGNTGGLDPGDVVDLGETSFLGALVASNVEEFVPLAPNLTNDDDQTPIAHASEPATLLLLGSGLLWQARRRRAQRQK
jgi:hypothetical protein